MFIFSIGCGHARAAWPGVGMSRGLWTASIRPKQALMLARSPRARQGIRHVSMALQYTLFNLMQIEELGRLDAGSPSDFHPFRRFEESPSGIKRRPFGKMDDAVCITVEAQQPITDFVSIQPESPSPRAACRQPRDAGRSRDRRRRPGPSRWFRGSHPFRIRPGRYARVCAACPAWRD